MQTQPEARDAEIHSAIVRYLERGLSVIPVGTIKKVPCFDWLRYQRELASEDDVEDWFRAMSNFNVGLVTGNISGVIVIDADTPEAVEFCIKHKLTSPIRVVTRRGLHFYWKHPGEGLRFACRHHNAISGAGFMDFPHLDFKGDGGYVVVPPSISRRANGDDFTYAWQHDQGIDWDDMPTWRGPPSMADVTDADPENFQFNSLNLAGVSHEAHLPVRERMAKRVAALGHKLVEGDGRNQALIQYAGEQVRRGVDPANLYTICRSFEEEFFLKQLEPQEFDATLRSALDMDRRNHPADYKDGQRLTLVKAPAVRMRLLTAADVDALKATAEASPWLCDPWLRQGSISQVFAYTGHGKSLFTLGACWHMALPKTDHSFGPFDIPGPATVLYFDWENSKNTLADRMDLMKRSYGDPGDRLQIWSQSVLARDTGPIQLLTKDGIAVLKSYVDEIKPQIVVIDTIRSAYEGMKENDAESWAVFNRLVTRLRALGCTVVALHHANKPTEFNPAGREAGSTNQLTAIEVQLRITPLYRTEAQAKQHNGMPALGTIKYLESAMQALAAKLGHEEPRLVSAIQLSYGKNRDANENSTTRAMAFCEAASGVQFIAAQRSPKQYARHQHGLGMGIDGIFAAFQENGHTYSKRSIRSWVERVAD